MCLINCSSARHKGPLLGTTLIDYIKQCSIILMLCKVVMELLLDYEYSCIFNRLSPKFSHGFLIKVYYSLRLLKFEYSASMCSCYHSKVGSCPNNDKSVHYFLLSFSV